MATGVLSPVPIQQFFDANGHPLPGGLLHFYLAGTDTRTPVYGDVTMLTPLSNPVVFDAAGRAPEMFLDALSYKAVLQNAAGVTIWTADNITSPSAIELPPPPEGDPPIVYVGTEGVTGTYDVVLPVPHVLYEVRVTGNSTLRSMTPGTRFGEQVRIVSLNIDETTGVFISHLTGGYLAEFHNRIASGPTPIGHTGSALYTWHGSFWVLVEHDQGKAIRLPYNAANYYGTTGGAWTVPSSSVLEHSYLLNGNDLMIHLNLGPTTIGVAGAFLNVTGLPFSFRAASFLPAHYRVAGWTGCYLSSNVNTPVLSFARYDSTAFPADTVHVNFHGSFTVN